MALARDWSAAVLDELPKEHHFFEVQRISDEIWPWEFGTSEHAQRSMPQFLSPSYTQWESESQEAHDGTISSEPKPCTPPSTLEETLTESVLSKAPTPEKGTSRGMRRKEQNRASQRAYRDRQRNKIVELQTQVLALKAQIAKLQERNEMLEAAFLRDRSLYVPAKNSIS
ncbi:Putative basic-leucine zipper domain-containing protein [Septoria linicola]|uniref:Basic-leucine zipper domain-containing protein n=1 Tax=Septoria linicola TaxID=215465 RepID=A0A9Q9EFG1_9PEZI|nr:putative basic-leucine zipper domain-containing protein [Septoria linicola]USW47193.1 Putative basic-leucine zipper domain-containing protein [Septoria linicola]